MAALESTQFVHFTFPSSNPPFHNRNALWPAKTSRSAPSLMSSQKIRRSVAARVEGADNDDESDDDLPSLEELFRTPVPPSNTSTEASKIENTLEHLEYLAPDAAGTLVDRTKLGLGERQGDSLDQPVILDDDELDEADTGDEAEGASGDVETGCIERDPSPYNTLATPELPSGSTKSIDASGQWFDVEEGCYVEEPASRLGSCEQQDVPSAPAQNQPQTLLQSFQPLQNQVNQQDVGSITRSVSVESAPHSLLQMPNNDDSMTELEKEWQLALLEQVKLLSASALNSPRSSSVEALPDESQSRERTEIIGRLEDPQDASQHGTPAQGLGWEQQETQVVVQTLGRSELREEEPVREAGGVEMRRREELGWREEAPARRNMGDQPDLIEVIDADDPKTKETTENLPATPHEINEHHFRLRGIRTRQLAERQTKTIQYRVVWGKHPNRSDAWVNEDDIRISVLQPSRKRSSQDSVLLVERDVVRVRRMRYNKCNKFDYLVDKSTPWITEDRLRISLSPMLAAELEASSPHPLSQAQRDVFLRHSATPTNDEHRYIPRASRSPSAPSETALEDEPLTQKRGHQAISSDIQHSANIDDNYNACDTGDENPRPAKRRKSRAAPIVTSTTCQGHTPELHVGQPGPLMALSTATPEIDDMQPQVDHECLSTFVDNSQQRTSRICRSPSVASETVPVAEYQEWPFQGFLKRTRVGDGVTYNLEFKLPSISEHLQLPIDSKVLDICSSKEALAKASTHHDVAAYSKIHPAAPMPRKKRVPFTPEEDEKLLDLKKLGLSWKDIGLAFPKRNEGTLRARHPMISSAKASETREWPSGKMQQQKRRDRARKQA